MLLRLLATAQLGMPCASSLPDALEACRKRHGLTVGEFTALLGLQRSHMREVLAGKRTLPLGATRRAYALGVPADALLQTPNAELSRPAADAALNTEVTADPQGRP